MAASFLASGLAAWLLPLSLSLRSFPPAKPDRATQAVCWLTTPDKSALFQPQPGQLLFWAAPAGTATPTIGVDDAKTFQIMDGVGYYLTGSSVQLLRQFVPAARAYLLRELFATDGSKLGMSYLRLSIIVSDPDA